MAATVDITTNGRIGNAYAVKAEAAEAAFAEQHEQRCKAVVMEVRRRAELTAACLQSEKVRGVVEDLCRSDPVRFIDDWLWTYDPRNAGTGLPTKIPLVLRPKQIEYVRWLEAHEKRQKSALVEKSRDEGMTFVTLAFILHHFLFRKGFSGGVGSRKEKLVDEIGNPDALFPKLRYMLYGLPAWMLPKNFSRKEHDNYLRLVNPNTEANITGEGGDNMGRGGRASMYFVDEWAFVSRPRLVDAALSQNTHVLIKGSTPNGVGNQHYEDRFSERYDVFTFHWRDNPAKNFTATYVDEEGKEQPFHPWYWRECEENDPLTIAQEVDIDYTSSVANTVIPAKWVQAAVDMKLKAGAVNTSGLDVAAGGHDEEVYTNRRGGLVTRIKEITSSAGEDASDVEDLCKEDGCTVLYYDRLGVGYGITATLKRKEAELPFDVTGISNADAPTKNFLDDRPRVPSDERFYNYAAELWWMLRLRFKRTYERAEGIADAPDDECIGIPNNGTLVAQLSQPTYSKNASDKIRVDKMGHGTKSPDYAESLMYAFARERKTGTAWKEMQSVTANVN